MAKQSNTGNPTANEAGIAKYFEFGKHGTNFRREIVAGITTFLAMAYILAANPFILGEAGMSMEAVFTATAIAAVVGTLVMGIVAKYPIALAPGMGLNAFFAYTVVLGFGIPWEQALLGVFISGILFLILAITGIREMIINAIPQGLKYAVSAGIGLFIAFIGLQNGGIIVDGPTLVALGDFTQGTTLLAVFGIVVTALLLTRGWIGGIFYGILITAIVGMIFGLVDIPSGVVSAPPNPDAAFALFTEFNADTFFTGTMLVVILTFLFVDFFDTAGTLVGVASQANLLKDNKLPRAGRALASDSIATIAGAVVGTSTTTSYIESASGVASGGRTGFTAVVTAACFFLALFFFPVISVIANVAAVTSAALVIVGVLMASNLGKIEWGKIDEAVPAFITVIAMPFTYSIATGIALGFILYPLTKVVKGEGKKVHPIMYIMFIVFLAYFIWLRE